MNTNKEVKPMSDALAKMIMGKAGIKGKCCAELKVSDIADLWKLNENIEKQGGFLK